MEMTSAWQSRHRGIQSWNAVSHRTWCVWPHTAAFGSLIQAPWKQLPACFIYSTPVQPVSLGCTWRANNSGMTPTQYTLGWHWIGLWATGNTLQRRRESYKAGIISWWNLLDPLGVPTLTLWDHLRWLCITLWQNTVAQCGNVPHMLAL